jgi:wobble nucleotide-excising tRNase
LDSLLQNFNGYFDKSYEDFITELKGYSDKIQNVIESIRCKETSAGNLGRLYEKYKVVLGESQFAQFSFSNLMKELTDIKTAINAKLTNIQSSSAIPKSVTDDLFEMNKILDEYVTLKTTIDTTLNAKQLNTNKIEDQLRETYKDMIILEFDKTDKDGALAKYKSSKESIAEISTMDGANDKGLLFYQNKRREELKKIKVESRSISKFLKQMGIEHFTVDINNEAQDENIIIKYNSSETDKNKLRNCLSEGEKTALAFAYFLSKFENERETEDKRRESVVVIDDPISSLDENRLYSTAFLIHNNFKNVKQLIVLSHNFLFLKFFKSLSTSANCLFLNSDKLSALPEELENFESPYFYMLKSVIEFANGAGDYQNAKKYLPNYIRRVLETFSSFKFAKFAKHERLLNKFEENIKNMSMPDEEKSGLIEKIAYITKATNQHSHGNAQLTDENFYISEDELKKLAQTAVSVIETVDNVHYASCLKDRE